MRKFIAITLLILGLTIATVHGLQTRHKIVIPNVLTYPTTTMTFSSKDVVADAQVKAPAIKVKFDNPNWAASVSNARWVNSGGGTYFKFTCEAASAACMQATKGTGTYTYVIALSTVAVPKSYGRYSYTWDVRPPGDIVCDGIINTPEIDPATGTAALALIGGVVLMFGGRKKNAGPGK
jgi:hypothetical protein